MSNNFLALVVVFLFSSLIIIKLKQKGNILFCKQIYL